MKSIAKKINGQVQVDFGDYVLTSHKLREGIRYRLELEENVHRDITKEEAQLEITVERINQWMRDAGEDFEDYNSGLWHDKVFAPFCMALKLDKEWSKELLRYMNEEGGYFGVKDIYEEMWSRDLKEDEEHLYDDEKYYHWEHDYYTDLCKFINQTDSTKARVNKELINHFEYYNE